MSDLILVIFPGIDLLGKGFEKEGFCVVRGPDIIWGGDIRLFHPPKGVFVGVVGGPPCQDFSQARRAVPTGNGMEMLNEFVRCVALARPKWWVMENVPRVPDVKIDGYSWQRIDLNASEFGLRQRRLRHIQFGHIDGKVLIVERQKVNDGVLSGTITCNYEGPISRGAVAQGLPEDFDIPPFTKAAKKRAIANGVPVPMARAIAKGIRDLRPRGYEACPCSCGRSRNGYGERSSCRVRVHRRNRYG